ncbi:unnamed protein product [Ectocarpus sp. CCAP 1310/34]|nr:unnamed protein product [Ectocarpus sp. CCAP 1310/34]
MPRAKKRKLGRGSDGRIVSKALAQQHDPPVSAADVPSVGDAPDDSNACGGSASSMDEDEEGAATNDEDWCDEEPSRTHSSGGGQSILRFAGRAVPVVTKVLESSEDLKNTHTYNEKKVSKSPKRYT